MSGRDDAICDDAYAGDSEDGIVSRSVHYLFHQVRSWLWERRVEAGRLRPGTQGVFCCD